MFWSEFWFLVFGSCVLALSFGFGFWSLIINVCFLCIGALQSQAMKQSETES